MGKNKQFNCLDIPQWRGQSIYGLVLSVYNASKNNELATLRSLLDVIKTNQQRSRQQFDTFYRQKAVSKSFIKKLGMCFYAFYTHVYIFCMFVGNTCTSDR